MAQIFHPSANVLARASIFGALFALGAVAWLGGRLSRSPYATQAGVIRRQPVPFSHEQHVGGVGIDCRYCHTSVETSAFAGMPSAKTCMSCHSQLWTDSPALAPIRAAASGGPPVAWVRIHDLPDFAYFDHSIHVAKGIGCASCHGAVDRMPLTWRESSLQMAWCLDCHRGPEQAVRPREEVFNMSWLRPLDDPDQAKRLMRRYRVERKLDCSSCHR
ncbi:MAG: cytochrome c3 family protein [Elusimicrobia bacterium]|nr:cytochrome c3 family protein [Elusimicrobiota bacterium]